MDWSVVEIMECTHQSIDRNGKCRGCNTLFLNMAKQDGVERVAIEDIECDMCKQYQEVQDIKTARIKELKEQLAIAEKVIIKVAFASDNNIFDHIPECLDWLSKYSGDKLNE